VQGNLRAARLHGRAPKTIDAAARFTRIRRKANAALATGPNASLTANIEPRASVTAKPGKVAARPTARPKRK
jgi:hypothetical protein